MLVQSGAWVNPNRHLLLVVLADTAARDGDDDHNGHQGPCRYPQVQPAAVSNKRTTVIHVLSLDTDTQNY